VSDGRWAIADAHLFLVTWGRQAEALGWPATDLFGLRPTHPTVRYDRMGMLWFLKGERVVALTATAARFSGGLAFYRRP
jgi:hypothetical protein